MNINDHINIIHNPHLVETKAEYISSAVSILVHSGFNRGVAQIRATQAANKIFDIASTRESCLGYQKSYTYAKPKSQKINYTGLEPAFLNLSEAAGISIYEAREALYILVPKLFGV